MGTQLLRFRHPHLRFFLQLCTSLSHPEWQVTQLLERGAGEVGGDPPLLRVGGLVGDVEPDDGHVPRDLTCAAARNGRLGRRAFPFGQSVSSWGGAIQSQSKLWVCGSQSASSGSADSFCLSELLLTLSFKFCHFKFFLCPRGINTLV